MVDYGFESTPLLLDSLSPPPTASSLSRSHVDPSSYARRRGVPGRRLQKRSQVHPLHDKYFTSSSPSSSLQLSSTTSSSNQYPSSSISAPSSPSHQTISSNKIWQIVVSLPHTLLCFASPICAPVCGICCCVTCIRTSEYGVMQRFGKFDKILHPGMHLMKWPMEREAGRISMRIRQLDVDCETKSKDHGVFVS